MNHTDFPKLGPAHLCAIGSGDDSEELHHGKVPLTRHEAPKESGGTAHKGFPRGGSKLSRPDHGPGPRGDNPKRAEARGESPGGPKHKDVGEPAGHLGQGKSSRFSMKKPT